jgi:AraC-like DNA-binding protein
MLKHIKNIKSHSKDGVSNIWFTPINQYYTRTLYSDIQPELTKTFPLHLDFVNNEHCFEKYYRRRETSGVFSIELVLKGSMHFVQNEKKHRVMAGSVFLIHYDHDSEFATGPEGHCHRLACSFGGHELNGLLHTTRLIEHDVIKLNNWKIVKETMYECFEEFKKKKTGFRRRTSILCYKLLLELEENLEQINTPDLLLRAVDLMEHHISQQLSLKKIAQALHSAPTSLNRVFQQHFNISPINYFINLKMEAAKSLLTNTNMQIQEVAQNTGYSNSLYFSSEFKKRIGMSPREFRKNIII